MHIPQRELRPGTKCYPDGTSAPAWDVYLDGELIASEYASEAEALLELDLAAWHALFGDAPLAPTALITDEAIGLAMQVFNRLFGSETIQRKALDARDKIIRPRIYTIHADGSLSVLASSGKGQTSYAVTAQPAVCPEAEDPSDTPRYRVTIACECRDFYVRAHAHGGVCKHVAARMLLALAQRGAGALKHLRDALDASLSSPITNAEPAEEPAETSAMAFLSLAAPELAAALFLGLRAEQPLALHADNGLLRVVSGPIDLSYPCQDGSAAASVQLALADAGTLYDALRAVAPRLGALTLFLSPADGTVIITDDTDFSVCAQGEAVVCPAPALPIPPTTAVEALHELFTLLEAHEPEWYLKRHYRLAHTALSHAGRIA